MAWHHAAGPNRKTEPTQSGPDEPKAPPHGILADVDRPLHRAGSQSGEGCPMVLAGPGLTRASGAGLVSRQRRWALPVAALICALALAAYLADMIVHPAGKMLDWYDLKVYNDAGLVARHSPDRLYKWQLHPGIKFTYTPFAGLIFGAGSLLSWAVLKWLMTVASLAALAGTAWFTFGGLGWRGRSRAAAALALTAAGLWTEPVQRGLHLGQVELLLMVLIVWDICQPDRRRWKGIGIGVAAGIKLVPLIFIPYLVLIGKLRQAAVATAAFLGTAAIGFIFLPRVSATYWLTGYFVRPGNVGDVGSLLNQSLFGLVVRAAGGVRAGTPVWLALAAVVLLLGLAAAAVLYRGGRLVAGWLTCALTGLLCSPISWDHHWVWIVPAMALFIDSAVRARGAARSGYWALAAVIFALFGAWPDHYTGSVAFLPQGLLGFFIGPHPEHMKYYLKGAQVVSWNLFVLTGLALLALAVTAAVRIWLAAPAAPIAPGGRGRSIAARLGRMSSL
jgi:alpha-1,2-mannosyltransferase